MKNSTWKLAIYLLAAIFITGCGNKEQEAEPTKSPEVTQIALVPVANEWTEKMEGLCESLEKVDAAERAKYNVVNRMISYDVEGDKSLFCIDEDTGVVYFVNQNKDFYIYRMKDGETALAVPMPARELYTYGGSLYFMVESYGKYKMGEIKDGDIYRYTPETGKIELVYAAGAEKNGEDFQLVVDERGIYFSYDINGEREYEGKVYPTKKSISYYLPFGAKEPVLDDFDVAVIPGWGDYSIGPRLLGGDGEPVFALTNRTDGSDYKILPMGPLPYCCIMEDNLYYLEGTGTKFCVFNLATGEQEEYELRDALRKVLRRWSDRVLSGSEVLELTEEEFSALRGEGGELKGSVMLQSFTMDGQYFWIVSGDGEHLIRINRASKATSVFKLRGYVEELYTDGEQLYGLCAASSGGVPSMARILTEQFTSDEWTGKEYEAIEYLTD